MTEEDFQRQELERQETEAKNMAFNSEEAKKSRRLESALAKLEVPLDVEAFIARMQQVREEHLESLRKIEEAFDAYNRLLDAKLARLADLMIRHYEKMEG